jgi:Tfp pilus assembly protein PilV
MKQESGLTLIEVLTTITLLFIVLGIGFAMLSTVQLFMNTSEEKYNSHSDQNIAVNTITKELADSEELYYTSSIGEAELRFKPFTTNTVKSIVYNQEAETLTLYESSSSDIENFTRDSSLILSGSVISFAFNEHQGSTVTVQGLLSNDRLYELALTFKEINTKVNGNQTTHEKEIVIVIKPFQISK